MRIGWYAFPRVVVCSMAVVGALLTGCTPSSGTRQVEVPVKINASKSAIGVKVAPPSYGMAPEVLNELLGATIAALRETRRFGRVSSVENSVDESPDLILEIQLTATREVTNTLRGGVGLWAGSGSFVADVRVVETATRNVVGKAVVGAITSGGSIAAGTNSEAVDRFTEQVVEFMLGR